MAANQINLESLKLLLVAVNAYADEVEENKMILLNAAEVCEQAMGSDPISRKKVARLKEALGAIDAALSTIESAAEDVISDRITGVVEIVDEA